MGDRRTVVAVVASLLVAAVVAGLVVAFGVRRLPSLPAVDAPPALDPPGRIAYATTEGDGRVCARVLDAAGGEGRTVLCADMELSWISAVGWSPEGRLLVSGPTDVGDEVVVVVDPATAEVIDRVPVGPEGRPLPSVLHPGQPRTRADGARLLLGGPSDGPAEVVRRDVDGSTRTLVAVDGPRDYRFTQAAWAPDGQWVAIQDSEGRLLVVDAVGRRGPRLLATDAADGGVAPAWYTDGDTTGTVDLDDLAG